MIFSPKAQPVSNITIPPKRNPVTIAGSKQILSSLEESQESEETSQAFNPLSRKKAFYQSGVTPASRPNKTAEEK